MNTKPLQMSAMFTLGVATMAVFAACSAEANRKVVAGAGIVGDVACVLVPLLGGSASASKLVCDIDKVVDKLPTLFEVEMRAKPQSASDGGVRYSAAPPTTYVCLVPEKK